MQSSESVIVLSSISSADDADDAIAISSTSSEDLEMNFDQSSIQEPKKKRKGSDQEGAVDDLLEEEELQVTADSVVSKVNERPENAVLRKLLRGPRYFDPGDRNSEACFKCGEEGHTAINCTIRRKKKPCFVCGMFGHIAKYCRQGKDCFLCKRRGHIARNCPDKDRDNPQKSIICLQCGVVGHDMLSCKNDYAPDDLTEIQCYVCKKYGHLCCVDFADNVPREIACYNCAQSGHTGQGCCNKVRSEMIGITSPTLCYKCGEEGHFARGCTKYWKVLL